ADDRLFPVLVAGLQSSLEFIAGLLRRARSTTDVALAGHRARPGTRERAPQLRAPGAHQSIEPDDLPRVDVEARIEHSGPPLLVVHEHGEVPHAEGGGLRLALQWGVVVDGLNGVDRVDEHTDSK